MWRCYSVLSTFILDENCSFFFALRHFVSISLDTHAVHVNKRDCLNLYYAFTLTYSSFVFKMYTLASIGQCNRMAISNKAFYVSTADELWKCDFSTFKHSILNWFRYNKIQMDKINFIAFELATWNHKKINCTCVVDDS